MSVVHLRAVLLPEGDRPLDLWIRSGRITFEPQRDADEFASGSLFVLPGLVDCHAHLALDMSGANRPWTPELIRENLAAHLRSGTLLVRDPGSPDGSSVAFQLPAEGQPAVQAAARFLAPEGRYLPFGQWTAPHELAEAAGAHARSGARWVKVIADWLAFDKASGELRHALNYDAPTLKAAVDAAHEAGARVTVHSAGPESARVAVEAGVDGIEHGDGLDADLLAEMARRGIAWTPTLALTEGLATVTGLTGDANARFVQERYERHRQLLPIAARLGVTVLAGTDMLPHGSVAVEVECLVRNGLEPRVALAAASTVARAYLGEPSLVEGAPARLVTYAADPRDDPEVLRSPERVMLDGRIVSGA